MNGNGLLKGYLSGGVDGVNLALTTEESIAISRLILLAGLRKPEIRQRQRQDWLDPSQPPSRWDGGCSSSPHWRDIGRGEETTESSQQVAAFLMRAIFTMIAEDVGLLDKNSFTDLLESLKDNPEHFAPLTESLWQAMNSGGFSPFVRQQLLRFNGELHRDAQADWRRIESAIFGPLLEQYKMTVSYLSVRPILSVA